MTVVVKAPRCRGEIGMAVDDETEFKSRKPRVEGIFVSSASSGFYMDHRDFLLMFTRSICIHSILYLVYTFI